MTHVRKTIGTPTGPEVFVPGIGYAVKTFEEGQQGGRKHLLYAVPQNMRGPYRPQQLANYDPNIEYVTDAAGYAMCGQPNKNARKIDPKTCRKRAFNRSPVCESHGGQLHPLDKLEAVALDVSKMTRWQQLVAGIITVDDLDDEELMRGMCRRPNGSFPERGGLAIPRKVYDKMVNRLFDRVQEKFRENLLVAVEELATIVKGDAFEPADKIKAISIMLDRGLGKAPDKVELTVGAKPFERILTGIEPISRDESRARRAIEAPIIDAEVVAEQGSSSVRYSDADGTVSEREDVRMRRRRPRDTASDEIGPQRRQSMRRRPIQRVGGDDLQGRSDEQVESAQAKNDLQVKVNAARRRRYAARANGLATTRNLPYTRNGTPLPEGGWRIQWIAPAKS